MFVIPQTSKKRGWDPEKGGVVGGGDGRSRRPQQKPSAG